MTIEQAQAIIASPFFQAFLDPAADRAACIAGWLSAQGIPFRTVTLQHHTHIIITFRKSAYNPRFKMKTVIAHYDRACGTPGANDNSAACIQLLLFAQWLAHKGGTHNIRIIFTDGEEAGAEGIKNQGAYRLGQGLRSLEMQNDDVFVFDLCGRGDTLLLSESGIYGRDKKKTKALSALHRRCCIYAELTCPGRWLSLPTAYSDNAGLISAGLSAQVFTVLPRMEAAILQQALLYDTRSESVVQNHSLAMDMRNKQAPAVAGNAEAVLSALQQCIITNRHISPDSPLAAVIPYTWQLMHSPHDSLASLTPEAFVLIDTFLHALAAVKEPIVRSV